jgi:hypothetical protein
MLGHGDFMGPSGKGIKQNFNSSMTYLLRHRVSVFEVVSERPVILTSKCRALGEK